MWRTQLTNTLLWTISFLKKPIFVVLSFPPVNNFNLTEVCLYFGFVCHWSVGVLCDLPGRRVSECIYIYWVALSSSQLTGGVSSAVCNRMSLERQGEILLRIWCKFILKLMSNFQLQVPEILHIEDILQVEVGYVSKLGSDLQDAVWRESRGGSAGRTSNKRPSTSWVTTTSHQR